LRDDQGALEQDPLAVPSTRDAERAVPDARRPIPGPKNALKHGHYTAEAIARLARTI
jgi:hypothetical protein